MLASTSIPAAVIAACVRPLLGISFFVTAFAALSLNGLRGTLASIRVRPAGADDPVSPVAIARTLNKMARGQIVFLGAMAVVYAAVALATSHASVRIFATAFAVTAVAAGPVTSLRRRHGLWVAACAPAVGLIIWYLRVGHV